jgi:hypothetical protein
MMILFIKHVILVIYRTRQMLGLPAHHWVHLAGISGGEILYLGSSIFVIIYPALSAAIRGRDGMDGGRAFWMTFYFWKCHQN